MHRIVPLWIAIGLLYPPTSLFAAPSPAGGNQVSQVECCDIESFHKAEKDTAIAEERIGDMFWQGDADRPRDRTEAVRHYDNAANLGAASAERKLAIAYANGEGTQADDTRMLHWQRKAAEAGDAMAAGMLGYAILIGLDGTYDLVEAATWLTLATDHPRSETWRSHSAAYARDAQSKLTSKEQAAFHARLAHVRSTLNGE